MDQEDNKKIFGIIQIKDLATYISIFLLLVYSSGFIAWNYFLSQYGFFEYNLLQTRYISAGILILFFMTLSMAPFILFYYLIKKLIIKKIKSENYYNIIMATIFSILIVFIFY